MGLDQALLRGHHNVQPSINDEGEWEHAEQLLKLRKSYWLHNRILSIGVKKLKLPVKKLNCKYIPLTKEELKGILNESKEVTESESEELLEEYFGVTCFSERELEHMLTELKEVNGIISRYLRNKKKTEYWYWSWW